MKNTSLIAAILALLATIGLQFCSAQGTAFTYQGRLQNNGFAANGSYDLTFTLYATNTGGTIVAGPLTNSATAVTNGLFIATLDFGPGIFDGTSYWLQIGVRTNGAATFSQLGLLQELTPVPYGIYAESAGAIPGLVVQLNSSDSPNLIGGSTANFVANGVVGATIGGGGATNWLDFAYSNVVTAPYGTVSGGLGNTVGNNYATVGGGFGNTAGGNSATVGGGSANTAGGDYSTVAGGDANTASSPGAFVGGGGYDGSQVGPNQAQGNASVVVGGINNYAQNSYATVAGGIGNSASGQSSVVAGGGQGMTSGGSVQPVPSPAGFNIGGSGNNAQGDYSGILGGYGNTAQGFSSAVSGGNGNTAGGYATVVGGGQNNGAGGDFCVIGGGSGNNGAGAGDTIVGGYSNTSEGGNNSTIVGGTGNSSSGSGVFIGGGQNNACGAIFSTISGGAYNLATNNCSTVGGGTNNVSGGFTSTVPGGYNNAAYGDYSFAAGNGAVASNSASFVWSDGSASTSDSQTNQFVTRASGGYVLYTSSGNTGVSIAPGSGTWSSMSDRNAKKDFTPVNASAVLAQVAAMPLTTWSYRTEPGVRHIGPMAQDFYAAFNVGPDNRHITTVDESGVAFAAIQGLNQELQARDAEIQALKAKADQVDSLEARLNQLEATVKALTDKSSRPF